MYFDSSMSFSGYTVYLRVLKGDQREVAEAVSSPCIVGIKLCWH